jgi:prolipoprotein diacylglyceryltransferase
LVLLAGLWFGLSLVERAGLRRQLPADALNGLVLAMLVTGLLGARLAYVVRFASVYWQDPLGIIALNFSTLALPEGVLLGLAAGLVYGQRRGLPLWPTLDALAPGLACLGVALGLSHLASGDAFGAPTDLPWALDLWGARRHPSQLYEIVAASGILFASWRMQAGQRPAGTTFLATVALMALARLLLEAIRGDSLIVLGTLRQAQLVSLLALQLALAGLFLRERNAARRLISTDQVGSDPESPT